MLRLQKYKVVVQNAQSSPAPVPFQQLLTLDLSDVVSQPLELLNLRFCADNGCQSPLYAWVESYNSDFSSVYVWVNIPYQIPANSQFPLYISKQSVIQYPFTGMAPQLTSTYAQYDNASSIFPYYQRWGSLSALPSGWNSLNNTVLTFNTDYIEIAPQSSVGDWYGIYTTSISISYPIVLEFYGNMYNSVQAGQAFGFGNPANGSWEYMFDEGYTSPPYYEIWLGADNNQFYANSNYDDTNTNKVYSILATTSSVILQINYSTILSASPPFAQTDYIGFYPSNNGGSKPSNPITVYWLRTRAYPPNGVMPSLVAFLGV